MTLRVQTRYENGSLRLPHFLVTLAVLRLGGERDFDRYFVGLHSIAAKAFQSADKIARLIRFFQSHSRAYDVANEGILLAKYGDFGDVIKFLNDAFHFRWVHLFSADVYEFGLAAENFHVFAVNLNRVACHEPAVVRKRTRRIQIAEHR